MGARIPEKGLSKKVVFEQLAGFRANDLPWDTGRVMAYTYHPGEETMSVSKEAYMMYLTENALDPTTFPSVLKMETDVVRMLATHLQGDENVVGNCTLGGTESILCAMKSARDWARKHRPEVTAPEIVIPGTAHPAFIKAGAYFDLKVVITAFDPETFEADVDAMRAAINDNTILLMGSAPGYAQGVVDPIPDIAALAQEKDLLCHVDACVGGVLLPFMREVGGFEFPDFDFSVPGVTSMSVDMHKYGYAPKNLSTVLYRSKDLRRHQIFSCRRTTTYALINPTVLSAKSGGPMAAGWATLHYLGEKGYREIARKAIDTTRRLVDGINAIDGLRVLGNPQFCMFSFTSDAFNIFELADEMRDRGWYVQPQFSTRWSPANLHISVTQATTQHVDAVLAALREAAEKLSGSPGIDAAAVKTQVQELLEALGDEALPALRGMAGVEDTDELPQHLALINTVMDALPDEMAEALLAEYLNDLYV